MGLGLGLGLGSGPALLRRIELRGELGFVEQAELRISPELRTHDARVRGAQRRELLLCVCVVAGLGCVVARTAFVGVCGSG